MRRKFPRDLFINGNVWAVKFVKKIPSKGKDLVGLCDPSERAIYIKTGQSFQETVSCFIHECLHALEFEHKFRLKHRQVYLLDKHLTQLYIDNF